MGIMMPKLTINATAATVNSTVSPAHIHHSGSAYQAGAVPPTASMVRAELSRFMVLNLPAAAFTTTGRIKIPVIIPTKWVVIWMVFTKRVGRFTIRSRRAAFSLPFSISSSSFPSFTFWIAEPKP